MKKEVVLKLNQKAQEIAEMYSKERTQNFDNETFAVEKIIPLSEAIAGVVFLKSSGKKAVAFLYWLGTKGYEKWYYFFPTDSHILGMQEFAKIKLKAEIFNYDKNEKAN